MENKKISHCQNNSKKISLCQNNSKKISHCQNNSKKNITLSEQFQKNITLSEQFQKNITLSEQFQKTLCQNNSKKISLCQNNSKKISHCRNNSKKIFFKVYIKLKAKKKYHAIGTIPKSLKEAKLIPLTHNYMTDHFSGLEHAGTSIKKWSRTNNIMWIIRIVFQLFYMIYLIPNCKAFFTVFLIENVSNCFVIKCCLSSMQWVMAHSHLNLPWIVDSFPQFKFYMYPHCMPLLICICKIVDVWKAFPYFSGEKKYIFWFVITCTGTCIIKTKVLLSGIGDLWLSCLDPLVLLLPNTIKIFGFVIFRYWVYLMKVIPEMCRGHY